MKLSQAEVNFILRACMDREKKMTRGARTVAGTEVELARKVIDKVKSLQKRRRPA